MLLYEGPTVNFVFVYDAERLRASQAPVDAGSIIKGTGFLPQPSGAVLKARYERHRELAAELSPLYAKSFAELSRREPKPGDWNRELDLRDFAQHGQFYNPQYLLCPEAAKARDQDMERTEMCEVGMTVECKIIPDLGQRFVELQLGMQEHGADSPFLSPDYPTSLRDRLLACIEALIGLPGFEFGFEVLLAKDRSNEGMYRERFSAWIEGGRFSLRRLLSEMVILSVAAGGDTLRHCGRDVFDTCPAWRVSHPSPESVCVFIDNLTPHIAFEPGNVQYIREAREHLLSKLKD